MIYNARMGRRTMRMYWTMKDNRVGASLIMNNMDRMLINLLNKKNQFSGLFFSPPQLKYVYLPHME
jgi:hypothetical protein